jgi:hypothetical protein
LEFLGDRKAAGNVSPASFNVAKMLETVAHLLALRASVENVFGVERTRRGEEFRIKEFKSAEFAFVFH